ncbi:AraC family transcriptional regulator [Paenibacillus sp. 2RAB27]|uniref:hypothetical protein n=1 Tax=Paenibacillus sp. 2RAB27 TaxID=3232991 RepID=UPI003F9DD7EB
MSYLYALRIEKAKIMFLQTDLLAKEIASRVGKTGKHTANSFLFWGTGLNPEN